MSEPIPMLLFCPRCHRQHIDAPNPAIGWTNPPHRSHRCEGCGCTWRPADVETAGVEVIQTRGKADTWQVQSSNCPPPVRDLVRDMGGTIDSSGRLPDGSGFATASFPLSPDHWLYAPAALVPDAPPPPKCAGDTEGPRFPFCEVQGEHEPHQMPPTRYDPPPMPLRMQAGERIIIAIGKDGLNPRSWFQFSRDEFDRLVRTAGRYAVRAATMNGKEIDFDPDALIQNLTVAFTGYYSDDGLSDDAWANPPEQQRK